MASDQTVYLFDVDNTLVDNDRIQADMAIHLERAIGAERNRHYWGLFEELRKQLGYADYLGALQRYRVEFPRELQILEVSDFLINYPFANRLYPNSLDVIERCKEFGGAVIVSDGDVVFQPLKVRRSGLYEAFDGNVLIYIHKEFELDDIAARYPAAHYVFIDDKVRILSAVKQVWGTRVTTVFPRQGHYALDQDEVAKYPAPDVTIERIGALVDYDLNALASTPD
ncbi:MAG: HAD family hydrolase [Candidatus Binataceae bacterium]|jgi:FMN phosphatase YigB (HAD superfamily)